MSIYCPIDPPNLAPVLSRIRKKREDDEKYHFSQVRGRALRAFFDLAQEHETLENFYCVCVFVPKEFMDVDSCLYLIDQGTGCLETACDSLSGLPVCGTTPPAHVHISNTSYGIGSSFVAPIRGNWRLISRKPLGRGEDIIGMFEVFPLSRLGTEDRLFFEKYANRIGYNLHHKLLAMQNVQHLRFINALVADIEHNVVVPNMHYRIFLRSLRTKIREIGQIGEDLRQAVEIGLGEESLLKQRLQTVRNRLKHLHCELSAQYGEVERHYNNTSLFLESLLRRDHFEKGQLVLRRRLCRFVKDVMRPQLERYRNRMSRRGLRMEDQLRHMAEKDVSMAVDLGLMSQVYANLLSNAEKYCQEVKDQSGHKVKFVSYGFEVVDDFFGPQKPGIKLNVFSTGPHLSKVEESHVFDQGFRGRMAHGKPGSGHGLYFVKKVVEVHGGVVGYESLHLGNNFFFILPLQNDFQRSVPILIRNLAEEA